MIALRNPATHRVCRSWHEIGLTSVGRQRPLDSGGFTHIEVLLWPRTLAALEAMAPVLEYLDAG